VYRLIFLLLFSIPIGGMNLESQEQPSCIPRHVVNYHDKGTNSTTDVIQAKNLWLRRNLAHSNNKAKFKGYYINEGQKIKLSEDEAELDFHSYMRKINLRNKLREELLNKLH
jgi:hypothetical protein